MRWATRAGVHIDRAACAWLIRRQLDPDAVFVFVTDPADVPADATAFDMRGVELGHHGDDCTFETILHCYEMANPPDCQPERPNDHYRARRPDSPTGVRPGHSPYHSA